MGLSSAFVKIITVFPSYSWCFTGVCPELSEACRSNALPAVVSDDLTLLHGHDRERSLSLQLTASRHTTLQSDQNLLEDCTQAFPKQLLTPAMRQDVALSALFGTQGGDSGRNF